MVMTAANSATVMDSVTSSLKTCFSAVIPSLFPFIILSAAFTSSINSDSFKYIEPIVKRVFGISGMGVGAFICGIISGYPIGAKSVAELYNNSKITKSEAESLLAYSNNSSPLFVIGAVGCGIYNSVFIGVSLYIVHIFSAIVCALILKRYTYSGGIKQKSTRSALSFTECICQGVQSVLKICGFIVFFSFVCKISEPLISRLPKPLHFIIYSITEITNGIKHISQADISTIYKLTLTAGALGWSGLSVHLQVKDITKETNLSLKKYFISKVFTSLLSAVMVYVVYICSDNIIPAINIKKVKFVFYILSTISLTFILILKCKRRGASSSSFERN